MDEPALWINPLTQRKILNLWIMMTTRVTQLARWKAWADSGHQAPTPISLVFQLPDKFTPTSVTNAERQSVVFHHDGCTPFIHQSELLSSGINAHCQYCLI